MSKSEPRGFTEVRIQASQLLKDLRSGEPKRERAAAERLLALPYYAGRSAAEIVALRGEIRRKQALEVIALERGQPSYAALKRAIESTPVSEVGKHEAQVREAMSALIQGEYNRAETFARNSALKALAEIVGDDEFSLDYEPVTLWVTMYEDVPGADDFVHEQAIRVDTMYADGEGRLFVSGHFLIDPEDQAVEGDSVVWAAADLSLRQLIRLLEAAEANREDVVRQEIEDAMRHEWGEEEMPFLDLEEDPRVASGWTVFYRAEEGKRWFEVVREDDGGISFRLTDAK